MSITCDNIIFNGDDEMAEEGNDPLASLNIYAESPKYYRLEETVFAEPIAIHTEDVGEQEANRELHFTNNLSVEEGDGQRNECFIDIDKTSPSHMCPQVGCNKSFSTLVLLRTHIHRVHGSDHKYVCERCAAAFREKYLLQRHMAVHSQVRIECPLCGKMLSRRTNMSTHLRCHADTRAHACPQCPRTFVRRATLNTHLRFVHRKGELCCHRCGEGFPSRKLLMIHKACRPK